MVLVFTEVVGSWICDSMSKMSHGFCSDLSHGI